MRAFHERSIERDYLHQRAESELSFQQYSTDLQFRRCNFWVEKQFYRVVAVLAVDIDAAREIRRFPIILPVVIIEPRVWLRNRHEVTGALVVETSGALAFLIQHARDSFYFFDERFDGSQQFAIVHINVRNLMIGDGESLGVAAIEQLASEFVLNHEPPLPPEHAVERNRALHGGNSVFG